MERRTSLGGGHLSLSTSNLASPLAESTQLNGSGFQTKFPWGGKVSPVPRSPAATSNSSNNSSFQQKSVSKVAVSPIRRIDPRIYTDVQSKGLASRIVKYHENSARLNRSASVGNLYSKPGQFPVVHLKKTEVQVKPRTNSGVSVLRIAPPTKRMIIHIDPKSPRTRSNAFRTRLMDRGMGGGSIPDEKDSHHNRPIVPPAENDVNPTRSVLDALKEISRKRINSDDVDCNDSIKKYCKESDDDPRRQLNLPLTNAHNMTSQQVSVITKRQREIPTPTDSKTVSPDSSVMKKRLCTKNNDITSSLSSSLLLNTPKRKLQDVHGRPAIGRNGSPPNANLVPPQAKQQCNDRNFVLSSEAILQRTSSYPPQQLLTPIPATPAIEAPQNRPQLAGTMPKQAPPPVKPKLTLFNVDYDAAPQRRVEEDKRSTEEDEEGVAGISFIKPKKSSPILTGRNALIERVQSSKLSLMLSCLSGELNDSDDEVDSGVNKDKPKEVEQAAAVPLVAGNTSVTTTNSLPQAPLSSSGGLSFSAPSSSAPSSTSTTAALTTTTSTAATGGFSFGLQPATATTAAATISTTTSSETAKASDSSIPKPTFSFGSAPASEPSKSTTTTTSVLTTSQPSTGFGFSAAPMSSATPTLSTTTSEKPAATGGFTFGNQKTADATNTMTSNAAALTKSFSFGAPPAASTTSQPSAFTSNPATTTAPSLSFGSTQPPAFGTPAAKPSQPPPAYSFGTSATTTSATSLVPAAPTFGSSTVSNPAPVFGSTAAAAATANSAASNPPPPAFGAAQQQTSTFGGFGVGSALMPSKPPAFGASTGGSTFGNPAPTSNSGGFSFGSSAAPSTGGVFGSVASSIPATTAQPPALFGSVAANTTAPMFGSAAAATTTASNSTFSFGSTTATKPAFNFGGSTNTSATPAFGSATQPAANSQPAFAFGSSTGNAASQPAAAATTQSTPFSFGSATAPQTTQAPAPAFNFGGGGMAQPPSNTPSFTFGSNAQSNAAQPPGAPTKSFSFGGTASASAFTAVSNNNNKPAAGGGFAFNTTTAAPTSDAKNIFGSAAATPAAFSFNAKKDDKLPVFGSPASTNSSAPAFGAAPSMTPGKLFSFGGSAANNNNNSSNSAPSSNLFGSPSTNTGTTPSLFPATASANSPAFGSTTNASKPAAPVFSFGGSGSTTAANNNNNNNSSTAVTPFQFGSSAPTAAANVNKTFSFGGGSTQPPATGNVFGSTTTSNTSGGFNFSANGGGAQNTTMNNNNPLGAVPNPFSPAGGADGGAPRREIRTATRRLKKT